MTERGFHPFAVLHFLRKTILLYLLPLLQVLFARNWAALRTALVQGAALLTVLAAVSAAVLHAGRWRVDAQGTLRVRWRLGVRLDRCLKSQPAGSAHHRAAPALPAGRCQPGGAVPCRAEAHPHPAFERAERAVFS